MTTTWDPSDPLFRPLTLSQVMERTGRSRRTIDRWILDGRLRKVRLENPPEDVFVERDVVEAERATRRANVAVNRAGRPRQAAS